MSAQIGRNLSHLKEARALSTQELADASAIDRTLIEELLNGEGEIFADTLFQLAGALGVNPEELGAGIEWIPNGSGGGRYRIEGPAS